MESASDPKTLMRCTCQKDGANAVALPSFFSPGLSMARQASVPHRGIASGVSGRPPPSSERGYHSFDQAPNALSQRTRHLRGCTGGAQECTGPDPIPVRSAGQAPVLSRDPGYRRRTRPLYWRGPVRGPLALQNDEGVRPPRVLVGAAMQAGVRLASVGSWVRGTTLRQAPETPVRGMVTRLPPSDATAFLRVAQA